MSFANKDTSFDLIIKEEFNLEPNDFSAQYDIPQMKKEYEMQNGESSLVFDESQITVKSELNPADEVMAETEIVRTENTSKIISGTNAYQCDVCKTSFQQKRILIKHIKSIHASISLVKKSYECYKKYNKNNSQKSILSEQRRKHTKVHTRKKQYPCVVCQRALSSKSALVKHSRIHEEDKPFVCDVCQRSFTQKYALIIHSRIHTGERPYACDVCHKAFSLKNTLNRHSKIHTGEKPYACGICDKSFRNKFTLINHKRTHTGEKPYACGVCQKAFSYKKSLMAHSRIHTGQKPYTCDVCQKAFSLKYNMLKHAKIHQR